MMNPRWLNPADLLDSHPHRPAARHVQFQDAAPIGAGFEDLFVVDFHLVSMFGPQAEKEHSLLFLQRDVELARPLREADHRLLERKSTRLNLGTEPRDISVT